MIFSRSRLARAHHLARLLVPFLSIQIITQVVSAIAGIVVVRLLAIPDFAVYAIAVSVQASLTVLSDIGVSTLFLARAGALHADMHRVAELASTARSLRGRLFFPTALVAVPLLWWSLRASRLSLADWTQVYVLVALTVAAQISASQDGAIALAVLKPERQQLGLLLGAALRIATFCTILVLAPSYRLALFLNLVATMAQALYLRRVASRLLPGTPTTNAEDRRAFLTMMKTQTVNAVYFAFSAQLTLWLVGLLSEAKVVAEVGALGRLSNLIVLGQAAVLGFFAPRFARYSDARLLLRRYLQLVGTAFLASLALLVLAAVVPDWLLWIIGPKYSGLRPWLPLAMASALTYALLITMFGLHSARAWIEEVWISIPLTIAVQAGCLLILDVSTLRGALLFGWASSVPSLLVQVYIAGKRFRSQFRPVSLR